MKNPALRASSLQSLAYTCLLLAVCVGPAEAFQKSECNDLMRTRLNNGSISPSDDVFYRQNGVPMSNLSNIMLTLDGCRASCGAGASFYTDIGPRLTTWLIPILLLVGNMQIARLGPEKYFMILHVLGDPIDSMWSLLTKAEASSRCYSVARKNVRRAEGEETGHYESRVLDVGTLYAAIEELDGTGTNLFKTRFDQIVSEKRRDMSVEHFYHVCKEVANELSDSRSIEFLRAGLAVVSYLYQVISGFVKAVGGESSSTPGGRIATAMIIAWLIPTVLITNAIGAFASRRTCLRIMERFVKTVTGNAVEDRQLFSQDKSSSFFRRRSSATDFYSAQQWAGAVYCYRPRKNIFPGGQRDNSPALLLLISVLPLFLSCASSFAIFWVTPATGLGCRHMLDIGSFSLWLVSAVITWATWNERIANGRYHYIITMTKDAIIGIPIFLMIILSSCGLFNSCYCWSALFSRREDAHVVLDDSDERKRNAHSYYPAFVITCLGLQFVVFAWMLFLTRHGSVLFRRDEKTKQQDWLDTHVHRRHLAGSSTSTHSMSTSGDQFPRTPSLPGWGGVSPKSRGLSPDDGSMLMEMEHRGPSTIPLLFLPERAQQSG